MVTCLKDLFPQISIIGEEDQLIMQRFESSVNTGTIDLTLVSRLVEHLDVEPFQQLESSRLSVYIDPLDGTRQFVKGELGDVTIMIGACYDGVPIAGVIKRVDHGSLSDCYLSAHTLCMKYSRNMTG